MSFTTSSHNLFGLRSPALASVMSFVADRHRITNCLFGSAKLRKFIPCPGAREPVNFLVINRETTMKKLSLFAVSVGGALVCAAVPASFDWSSAKFSVDTAEARVGRPLTATSVAGVGRRAYRRQNRRAAVGATVGATAVGGAAVGATYVGGAPAYAPAGHMSKALPQPMRPDPQSPQHRRMAGRVMATAQGPTRTL